jgi:hypothetical protein
VMMIAQPKSSPFPVLPLVAVGRSASVAGSPNTRHRCDLDPPIAFGELGRADQQFDRLRFAQWREDIHMGLKLSNRPSTLGKSRKGFEPRLASWAMPEMANNLIIQKFRRVRCNDFMVAPNTVDSEHVSFIHPVHRA